MNIVGVILAAGESSRMGAAKQMLPFKGKTILQWVIGNAIASSLQKVIVVLGHQADLILPLIAGEDVTVICNTDYKSGQSTSIKAGMKALPEGTDSVLFMLGDQPLVTPDTINNILYACQNSENPIVMPVFDGKRGNPVLFRRETFSRLESLVGDCGARALFGEYAEKVLQVQVDDPHILFDLDTKDDYQHLLQMDSSQPEVITPVR